MIPWQFLDIAQLAADSFGAGYRGRGDGGMSRDIYVEHLLYRKFAARVGQDVSIGYKFPLQFFYSYWHEFSLSRGLTQLLTFVTQ
jgi:hypothetical protein